MNYKIAQLKDSIEKKSIFIKDKFIYSFLIHKGDFARVGSPLVEVMDMSQAKLVLFLEPEEMKNIDSKLVYIEDKKTDYKINKVWSVADKKFISSYRAEIYIPSSDIVFSKLLKVEIK